MLLHEFAIDPEIFTDWCTFRYFIDQCGVHHGRLISRFPSDWEKLVRESCDRNFTTMQRRSLEERLIQMRSKLLKSGRDYNREKTWVENTKSQHEVRPFRAVIVKANQGNPTVFLVAESVHEQMKPWAVPREIRIPRRANEMAECVSMLFQVSKRILLVDPYFKPKRKTERNGENSWFSYQDTIPYQFKESLKAFIEEARERKKSKMEYHICFDNDDKENKERIAEIFCEQLPQIIPTDFEFTLVIWKAHVHGKAFHARYVLTDTGGMRFEYGLDEGRKGQQTDVSLLDPSVHKEALSDVDLETYDEDPAKKSFELVGTILISRQPTDRCKVSWTGEI